MTTKSSDSDAPRQDCEEFAGDLNRTLILGPRIPESVVEASEPHPKIFPVNDSKSDYWYDNSH